MNSPAATIIKTFQYKLRKNRGFEAAALKALDDSRTIYNAALDERIGYYRRTGRTLGYVEQSRHLTEARTLPEVGACLRTIQTDALERLDFAFQAFFKRVKRGEGAGFPRFKGKRRYSTFSQKIEKQRACPLDGDRLTVPGVGSCRVRLSRPIEGTVKQLRITRRADGYYALLVCDVPKPEPLPKTGQSVGVDVGLTAFATLSTGQVIENPRHLRRAAKALKRSQQALSRAQKMSANRAKARQRVALRHLKVQRARLDFHHKTALDLVRRFDRVAVEDLQVPNLLKNHTLAKSISDAGWASFLGILACKVEWTGKQIERVEPRYTSQDCSRCGRRQKMPLAIRMYECACGLVLTRDENAAHNILLRAGSPKVKPRERLNQTPRRTRNRYARKSGVVTRTAPILPRA